MEPVTVLLATGAVAMYAAHKAEKLSERARRGPTTLPDMLAESLVEESSVIVVIAVRIRSATLGPQLAGRRVKLSAKYGKAGSSIKCEMGEVSVPTPVQSVSSAFVGRKPQAKTDISMPIGQTCLFLAHHSYDSVIRLRLTQEGIGGRTVGKAELAVQPSWSPIEEQELKLIGHRGKQAGALAVSIEMNAISKGNLRQCLDMFGADIQNGGAFVGNTTVCEGVVVPPTRQNSNSEESDEEIDSIVQGELIQADRLAHSRGLDLAPAHTDISRSPTRLLEPRRMAFVY